METGNSYSPFNLTETFSGSDGGRLVVRFIATASAAATVCLDGFSLEGPSAAVATPSPPPSSTLTPSPAATRMPAASPTGTRAALSPDSPRFLNGGFEDGLTGWQKFGGELTARSSPRRSGGRAGTFTSETAATKWAFQIVTVDPAMAYEFSGHIQVDAGVAAAYLRISWYEAADGAGSAIATDDSLTRLAGASGGFFALSTGPRTPPQTARSARLRVLLAPVNAAPAVIYLDDFSFAQASAGLTPPASTATADEPLATPALVPPSPDVSVSSAAAATATPQRTPSPVAAVAAVVQTSPPAATPPSALRSRPTDAAEGAPHLPPAALLLIGSLLAIAGFSSAYVYEKRRQV